jgi:hypothetical protein
MKYKQDNLYALIIVLASSVWVLLGCKSSRKTGTLQRSVQVLLSEQDSNVIKTSWPSIGCWFWQKEEFTGDGYKSFIDLYEKYSPFKLLTTSLRYPGDLTDPKVYRQIKAASLYAREKGMAIVMDLDIRLARDSFRAKYPDELQQIVFIKEFPLNKKSPSIGVKGHGFGDHYTYGRTPYDEVSAKLLRVYSYQSKDGLIQSGTIKDISSKAVAAEVRDSVHVSISGTIDDAANTACALVAFTINTPDVFAPHLLPYQREILQQYADASLAGACKDEWGFPGRFTTPADELWYSAGMAKTYAQRRPGRDLLRDMLLMSVGETGYEAERIAAVNNYMEMCSVRNGEIETDYYYAIKKIFGKDAMSATHPTWFPYPDNREIFKNGLDWWISKRDVAQTDEATPFSVRTALSKKMYSPLWFNMYYDKTIESYYKDIWRAALAGGRLNYHPLWPVPATEQTKTLLLKDSLMLAESRVSLLNYITEASPACPVAVVFGHPAALNWTDKKVFADVGLNVANALWKAGYYADLIPGSEIVNGSMTINKNGKVQYGPQEYEAVILYHPEYDKQPVADFFKKAGASGKTDLFRVGNWTVDFDAQPFDGNGAIGTAVRSADTLSVVQLVMEALKSKNIPVQTEGEEHTVSGFPASVMPKAAGQLKLIDGTRILIAGEHNPLGDTILGKINIDGYQVDIDAIGVAGIRMNTKGEVEALACGGLKSFRAEGLNIDLDSRVDIALIKRSGKWKGIMHSNNTAISPSLLDITRDWTIVRVPLIYKD